MNDKEKALLNLFGWVQDAVSEGDLLPSARNSSDVRLGDLMEAIEAAYVDAAVDKAFPDAHPMGKAMADNMARREKDTD